MTMALANDFDPELPVVEAIRGGDREAFGEWVRRHDRWMRGVIYGVLGDRDRVDDVAQQAWTAAWRRVGELRDTTRWRPWLYRLARNAAVDAGRDITRRRQRKREAMANHAVPGPGITANGAGASPDSALIGAETRGQVLSAVEALPALYREPFVLRHLNGWSYREIADVMRMPVDTVETRLVRARRLLRETLTNLQTE